MFAVVVRRDSSHRSILLLLLLTAIAVSTATIAPKSSLSKVFCGSSSCCSTLSRIFRLLETMLRSTLFPLLIV